MSRNCRARGHWRRLRAPVAVLALSLGLGLSAGAARAEQFVILDWDFRHTGDSHARPPSGPMGPSSWRTPDYANGKAHYRLEVKRKPNDTQKTAYTVCFQQYYAYTCGPLGVFTKTGVIEWSGSVQRFWQSPRNTAEPIKYDWTRKPDGMFIVTKDTQGRNVMGPAHLPIEAKLTVWIVSAGSALDRGGLPPPAAQPDAGASNVFDGGVGNASDAGAEANAPDQPPDASSSQDAHPSASSGIDVAPAAVRRDARAPAPSDEDPDPEEEPDVRGAAGCATVSTRSSGLAPPFVALLGLWAVPYRRLRHRRGVGPDR